LLTFIGLWLDTPNFKPDSLLTQKSTHWNLKALFAKALESKPSAPVSLTIQLTR